LSRIVERLNQVLLLTYRIKTNMQVTGHFVFYSILLRENTLQIHFPSTIPKIWNIRFVALSRLGLGHFSQNELNIAWNGRKMSPKLDEKLIEVFFQYWFFVQLRTHFTAISSNSEFVLIMVTQTHL
jgi:hypothetical protein